eukprot:Filipodium_phascolosomae@DN1832_c0_g1_i2.p1
MSWPMSWPMVWKGEFGSVFKDQISLTKKRSFIDNADDDDESDSTIATGDDETDDSNHTDSIDADSVESPLKTAIMLANHVANTLKTPELSDKNHRVITVADESEHVLPAEENSKKPDSDVQLADASPSNEFETHKPEPPQESLVFENELTKVTPPKRQTGITTQVSHLKLGFFRDPSTRAKMLLILRAFDLWKCKESVQAKHINKWADG